MSTPAPTPLSETVTFKREKYGNQEIWRLYHINGGNREADCYDEALIATITALQAEVDKAKWATRGADIPLPEDAEIEAAHPLNTKRHDIETEARRLVGARRSKVGLVDLVNWLLFKNAALREKVRELRGTLTSIAITEFGEDGCRRFPDPNWYRENARSALARIEAYKEKVG